MNANEDVIDLVTGVKRILPQLSAEQLRELSDLALALGKTKENVTAKSEDFRIELLYDSIAYALFISNNTHLPALSFWKGTKYTEIVKQLSVLVQGIEIWMQKGTKGKGLTRVQLSSFYALCSDLVSTEITERHIPLSLTTMLQNYKYLPDIFDREFPGYVNNGMISMVISSLKAVVNQ